jgi:hypothetical protein
VHAQLDEIHGRAVDKGPTPQGTYGEHKFYHGYANFTGTINGELPERPLPALQEQGAGAAGPGGAAAAARR